MIKNRESLPLIIGAVTVFLSLLLLILIYNQSPITENEITFPPNEINSIKITNPASGSIVSFDIRIEGILVGKLAIDQHMWAVISPKSLPGLWWPQGESEIFPVNGKWATKAAIGRGPSLDIAQEFFIAVILVDEADNKELFDWVNFGKERGDVIEDGEGMDTIREFAENIAWLCEKLDT